MNQSELIAKEKLEAEGWHVLKAGAPDFLVFRVRHRKVEIKYVEVKAPEDRLSPNQEKYRRLLERANQNYELWRVDPYAIPPVITKVKGKRVSLFKEMVNKFPMFTPTWSQEVQEAWIKAAHTIVQIRGGTIP